MKNSTKTTRQPSLALLMFLLGLCGRIEAFTNLKSLANGVSSKISSTQRSSTQAQVSYEPVFDFSDPDSVSKFDRIDDAIMGGISTSSLRPSSDGAASFASWSGVCRTDGGGFCGTRTLPFRDGVPLKVVDDNGTPKDGFYITAKLTSDNEPQKRIWKITTRVDNVSRSEQLYQADYEIPPQGEGESEWKTIRIPFSSFVQVRGPVLVPDGPPLDVSGGLYQIGLTMSKFQISSNLKELPNFRPGYFELQIKEIGVYSSASSSTAIDTPQTLSKQEAEQNKPAVLKILFPIAKLFFNEQSQRRKSATRILKERGLGRWGIAKFGFGRKVKKNGLVMALAQSVLESVGAVARFAAFWALKISLFYPLVAIRRISKKFKNSTDKAPQAMS